MKNSITIMAFACWMVFYFPCIGQNSTSLYQLKMAALDTGQINMNSYAGKKILVVVIDAANPDMRMLLSIDTLCKKYHDKLNVIAVPASEFSNNSSNGKLKKYFKDSVKISFPVTQICQVKKTTGVSSQNQLMNYLTSKSTNGHYDDDISKAGEIFLISEKGKLFGRFKEKLNMNSSFMYRQITKLVE